MTLQNDDDRFKETQDYLRRVPVVLKDEIGLYYTQARSRDPTIKIPNTRSLVSSLQTAMVICGNKKYDALIEFHKVTAINALCLYSQENWAGASEECDKVLDDVAFIVYEGYGSIESGSFTIPSQSSGGSKK